MFYLKKLLSALVLPPAGPILLGLCGIWLARRHARFGHGVAVFALLGLLALALPPVADALMAGLEDRSPITPQQLHRAQAIVILGGGKYDAAPEYGGDTVNRHTLERMRYGVHLQQHSGLPILVSGGAPFGGRPEGEAMKEAIERDLRGTVKWVEARSRDTVENAAYSATMLKADGITRVALVSHAWHLPRAAALFERQGFEVLPAPLGYTTHPPSLLARLLPSPRAFGLSCEALHEHLGLLVQRVAN